ncbi:MAG TPA: hypothetical protein VF823_12700 [Anaerolineales bacterium]
MNEGQVVEIRAAPGGLAAARVRCPAAAVPSAGQYLLAWRSEDQEAALAVPLFLEEGTPDGFLAAPPIPPTWLPGSRLVLRGPLGRGFRLPEGSARVALAAWGETISRLLPLLTQALQGGAAVTLFTDCPLPVLPAALEISPLRDLPAALPWADFLALDLPTRSLPDLPAALGLRPEAGLPGAGLPGAGLPQAGLPGSGLPCPAQALLLGPMPCAGMAECGACAVPSRRGWKLACKDGPVFDWKELTIR